MRVQRHIAQAGISFPCGTSSGWLFTDPRRPLEEAFLIVERRLCELEKEFEVKKARKSKRERKRLDQRARRQIA